MKRVGLIIGMLAAAGTAVSVSAWPVGAFVTGALVMGKARMEEPSLDDLVVQLDDPAYAVRQSALDELARRMVSPGWIESQLMNPALSPEQRTRLSSLGPRALMNTERGALGVQFDVQRAGVLIAGTVRGFDSERMLRPGDELVSIGGERVGTSDEARAAIIANDPGEEIELRVLRGGRDQAVRVRLGRFGELRSTSMVSWTDAARAWRIRLDRIERARGAQPALDTGLSASEWAAARREAGREATPTEPQPRREYLDDGSFVLVYPGAGAVVEGDRGLQAGGQPRASQADSASPRRGMVGRSTTRIERRADQQRQLEEITRKLQQPGLAPEVRAELQAQADLMRLLLNAEQILPGGVNDALERAK